MLMKRTATVDACDFQIDVSAQLGSRKRSRSKVELRASDWASRSLQREFELVIMVEVLIEEMFRSD